MFVTRQIRKLLIMQDLSTGILTSARNFPHSQGNSSESRHTAELEKSSLELVNNSGPLTVDADRLALDWLLKPKVSAPTLAERVLARLIQAEAYYADLPFRVDYRVAQVIVMAANRGQDDPINYAWQSVLHCRPEEVWPNIVNNRKLRLGAEYPDWYDANGNLNPDLPNKKSVQSVKATMKEARRG